MRVLLRDYQQTAVDDVRNAYRHRARAPLVALSTGAGKTIIFSYITERVQQRDKSVYILVHRQELLRQTSEHLELLGVVHGLIAPGHTLTGLSVQVASVQTLVRRLDRLPEPDLIVIDECHHATAGSWRKILDHWPNARLLGVTATPMRLDGTGLGVSAGGYFDRLIEGPSIRELISQGYLAPPLVYAPPSGLDMAGVRIKRGDFDNKETAKRVDRPTITGCAIEHYQRICPGVPAIAFCASVKHAENVAEQFNAAGIPAASLTGKMSDAIRKYRIRALATGGIRVLTSCDIISEGTDIPVVTTAILLRPTQSMGLYMQQVGRCLRPHARKTHAFILDHVGNVFRHGMPDEVRKWSLAGQKKKKRGAKTPAVAIRQCEKCFAVFPASVMICPQCGAPVRPSNAREIEHVDGNLVKMDAVVVNVERKRRQREVQKARTLDGLLAIARARGYNPAWAHHVFHARMIRGDHKLQAAVA